MLIPINQDIPLSQTCINLISAKEFLNELTKDTQHIAFIILIHDGFILPN